MSGNKIDRIKGIRGGFDVNPQNINKKGRPLTITNELKKSLEANGLLRIPIHKLVGIEAANEKIRKVRKNKSDVSVVLEVATIKGISAKLLDLAMTGRDNVTVAALKEVINRHDGVLSNVTVQNNYQQNNFGHDLDLSKLSTKELELWSKLYKKAYVGE